jgi:hypothetical protein
MLMNLLWVMRDDKKTIAKYKAAMEAHEAQAKALYDDILKWKETKDWDAEMEKNPDMADYFHNMKIICNSPTIQYKNQGYHASLLSNYLREKVWKEKQADAQKKNATKAFVGKVGEKISFVGTLKNYRTFDRQPMYYNDPGVGYLLIFNDDKGNDILYFPSKPSVTEADVGRKFNVVGTVKKQEVSKFGVPQTILTRAKVTPA